MSVLEWILIDGATAVRAACAWGAATFVALWAVIERVIDPLMSPVLSVINPVSTALASVFYGLCGALPPWVSLILLSAIVGVGALAVLRCVSNQRAIGRARDDIQANLLALKLFKDQLRVTFWAQIKLAGAIARLQWYMLWPLVIMLPPVLLLASQMQAHYQWRALEVGEHSVLKLTWLDSAPAQEVTVDCPNGGVEFDAGPVPGAGEVVWRLLAAEPGRHVVRIHRGDHTVEKDIVVGDQRAPVSPLRPTASWTAQLLYPIEPPISADTGIAAVELAYPDRPGRVAGASWWMLTFFVVSMVVALVLRPLFGVRF